MEAGNVTSLLHEDIRIGGHGIATGTLEKGCQVPNLLPKTLHHAVSASKRDVVDMRQIAKGAHRTAARQGLACFSSWYVTAPVSLGSSMRVRQGTIETHSTPQALRRSRAVGQPCDGLLPYSRAGEAARYQLLPLYAVHHGCASVLGTHSALIPADPVANSFVAPPALLFPLPQLAALRYPRRRLCGPRPCLSCARRSGDLFASPNTAAPGSALRLE